ncbi:MAG: hypothetical protein K8T10_11280 [Candidatus Eremiobacteraeota bacterium]|nr:hypothetical protein [Candidatus Eremiobacteraeota bacterium]
MTSPDKRNNKTDKSASDKKAGNPARKSPGGYGNEGSKGNEFDPSPWATSGSTKIKEGEKILLEITQHPFKRKWYISVLVILLILILSALSYTIIPNPLMPVFVLIFFIVSMTSFFLPSLYTFTEEKIVINRIIYCKAYPWTRFRSYRTDKNGVYLSPISDSERFDRFRGIFMVMDKDSRKKALPILEEYIGEIPGEKEKVNR